MIFTKRNAIVGYAALKALEQYRGKRRKKERRALRTIGVVALAVALIGALAGIAAAVARRQHASTAVAGEAKPEGAEGEVATPGNGRVSPEPAPAA